MVFLAILVAVAVLIAAVCGVLVRSFKSPRRVAAALQRLHSPDPEVAAAAAHDLALTAYWAPSTCPQILAAGGTAAALACLGSGSDAARRHAAHLLFSLMAGRFREAARADCAAHGLPTLVRLLHRSLEGEGDPELAVLCAGVLTNVAALSPGRCRAIAEAGAPAALARCLRSPRWDVVEEGAVVLALLDSNGDGTALQGRNSADIGEQQLLLAICRLARQPQGGEAQAAAAGVLRRLLRGFYRGQSARVDSIAAKAECLAAATPPANPSASPWDGRQTAQTSPVAAAAPSQTAGPP